MKGGVLNNHWIRQSAQNGSGTRLLSMVSRGTLSTVVSCFPAAPLIVPARSAAKHELQSIPSARSLRYTPARCFPSTLSPSFSFTPSFVFPNTEGLNETFHRPRGACFLRGETRRKRSQPRRGQIGWGSYLGRIMFDIPHHYQLPLCRPQESYLSLADVPLSVMNFLCPPTSSPPYLSAPHLQLRGGSTGKKGVAGRLGRGEEIKKRR